MDGCQRSKTESKKRYNSAKGDEFVEIAKKVLTTEIYLTSVNAMAETGEMVNIYGTGNRVAGSLFGHRKVYFVVGTYKIEPTVEKAIWRARKEFATHLSFILEK